MGSILIRQLESKQALSSEQSEIKVPLFACPDHKKQNIFMSTDELLSLSLSSLAIVSPNWHVSLQLLAWLAQGPLLLRPSMFSFKHNSVTSASPQTGKLEIPYRCLLTNFISLTIVSFSVRTFCDIKLAVFSQWALTFCTVNAHFLRVAIRQSRTVGCTLSGSWKAKSFPSALLIQIALCLKRERERSRKSLFVKRPQLDEQKLATKSAFSSNH